MEGGCEKGHRAGRWHIHEEPFHAIGRQLAMIVNGSEVAAPVADVGVREAAELVADLSIPGMAT
jgi:hypothetical protein